MIDNLFLNEWGIWYCFQGEPNESNEKYYENFKLIYNITSPSDLAYLWQQAGLSNLQNFFLNQNSQQNAFQIQQKWRRINSIEFFKKGIEPKWEDPKNSSGGRFIFSVNKPQNNKDEIYTNLIFYLLGEDFDHSEKINGFRFISPKNTQTFYRVQIWVDFNQDNMEVLGHFQTLLTNLFKALNFDSRSVRFHNNASDKETKPQKSQVK